MIIGAQGERKQRAIDQILRLPRGKRWRVEIKEAESAGTYEQLKYFWGVVNKALMEHHGYDKEEMYNALLAAYAQPHVYKKLDGTTATRPRTLSEMGKRERSAFIDRCLQHASENEVKLPAPPWYEVA